MPVLHVAVEGVVQGVGFRWFVRQAAGWLAVDGWVRNCPDGSVEVVARGEAQSLATLRMQLFKGPSGANVSAVKELAAIAEHDIADGFKVRH